MTERLRPCAIVYCPLSPNPQLRSTGGPASLRELFEALPNDHSLPPIVIVQHIPAGFVDDLVQRLRLQTGYDVRFAP